jgi:hypothetical protein
MLAGSTRWLAEFASGTPSDDFQCAPPTPIFGYTKPGHDHSGGLMGRPQQHTVWSAAYGWILESAISYNTAPSATIGAGGVSNNAQPIAQATVRNVWVPGGWIYNLLQFEAVLTNDIYAGGTSANVDYSVTVVSSVGTTHTSTGTITASTTAFIVIDNIPFQPGRLQTFQFFINISNPVAATRVYLIAAALHQTRVSG